MLSRLDGGDVVTEAAYYDPATDASAGMRAGSRGPLEDSPSIEVIRTGITRSWDDMRVGSGGLAAPARPESCAGEALINTSFRAGGSTYFLMFASQTPADETVREGRSGVRRAAGVRSSRRTCSSVGAMAADPVTNRSTTRSPGCAIAANSVPRGGSHCKPHPSPASRSRTSTTSRPLTKPSARLSAMRCWPRSERRWPSAPARVSVDRPARRRRLRDFFPGCSCGRPRRRVEQSSRGAFDAGFSTGDREGKESIGLDREHRRRDRTRATVRPSTTCSRAPMQRCRPPRKAHRGRITFFARRDGRSRTSNARVS